MARARPLRSLAARNEDPDLLLTWETFDHEADVGLIVRAENGPDLFAAAGLAFFDLVCHLEAVEERNSYQLGGEAAGVEPLLVDWLNDLVFLFEGEAVVCRRFVFSQWSSTAYCCEAFGEPLNEQRHEPRDLVKAATYHGLSVREVEGRWEARVILDV